MALKPLILTFVALTFLGGCTTAQERKATERAAVKKEVAQEVERICSLPPDQRDAELKKLKEQSAMELYCREQ